MDVEDKGVGNKEQRIMRREKFRGFSPQALQFLADLKRHNNRPWFQARKDTYEEAVKEPMAEMILSVGEALRRFAPEMSADPRGSLYRIYRDTRFSRDKTPYKTQVAAVFPVRGLPKHSGPGLYFHISAEEVLIGGGIYMPGPKILRAVREEIAASPRRFFSILHDRRFRSAFGELEGEASRSMPRGFSADHPAAEYLKYKQFLFAKAFSPRLALSPRLLPTVLDCFEKGMPLVRFLKKPAFRSLSSSPDQKFPRSATLFL